MYMWYSMYTAISLLRLSRANEQCVYNVSSMREDYGCLPREILQNIFVWRVSEEQQPQSFAVPVNFCSGNCCKNTILVCYPEKWRCDTIQVTLATETGGGPTGQTTEFLYVYSHKKCRCARNRKLKEMAQNTSIEEVPVIGLQNESNFSLLVSDGQYLRQENDIIKKCCEKYPDDKNANTMK